MWTSILVGGSGIDVWDIPNDMVFSSETLDHLPIHALIGHEVHAATSSVG